VEKLKKKLVLFDLDGTLTDSGEGIRNSVRHALENEPAHSRDFSRELAGKFFCSERNRTLVLLRRM